MNRAIFAQRAIFALALLVVASPFAAAGGEPESYEAFLESIYRDTVPRVTPDELERLLSSGEEVVLLDIRSQAERSVSSIAGSRLEEFESFDVATADSLEGVAEDALIVTYCAVGWRSERAGEELLAAGYKNVRNVYGGIFQWQMEGKPLARGDNHPATDQSMVHGHQPRWGKWVEEEDAVTYEPEVE